MGMAEPRDRSGVFRDLAGMARRAAIDASVRNSFRAAMVSRDHMDVVSGLVLYSIVDCSIANYVGELDRVCGAALLRDVHRHFRIHPHDPSVTETFTG